MKRRSVVGLLGSLPLLGFYSRVRSSASPAAVFQHGVASGDPDGNSVVLWTRVTPRRAADELTCCWRIASDAGFRHVVDRGVVSTGSARDFTVKVVARHLRAGRDYYYDFSAEGEVSPAGRTHVLPAGHVPSLRFAAVSCSNHPAGYFNVYRDIARQSDIDAVIHLGDYIYEYGIGGYASENAQVLGRMPRPDHPLKSLSDYRVRHAQYKADPDLQALHAQHPMIAIWDDHDFLNNSWMSGSEGFRDTQDAWKVQRAAALQAYREWMPLRDLNPAAPERIFRSFHYGDLLSLILLDTRHFGRDRQLSYASDLNDDLTAFEKLRQDPARTLLGREQERWLERTLKRSSRQQWQLIAQQVLVSELRLPQRLIEVVDPAAPSRFSKAILDNYLRLSRHGLPLLLDTWDGYADARRRLLTALQKWARNPIIVSGDIHTSMAGKIRLDGKQRVEAVELVTPPVTSPGLDEYFPSADNRMARAFLDANPDLLFLDGRHRGWLDLRFDRDACAAQWRFVDTVLSRDYSVGVGRAVTVPCKDPRTGYRGIDYQLPDR